MRITGYQLWCFLVILFFTGERLFSQIMHSTQELEQLKQETKQTLGLGRIKIIEMAAAAITDDVESIFNDPYVWTSVWYNEISVKVHFEESVPLKYVSSADPSYYQKVDVFVSTVHGAYSIAGTYVPGSRKSKVLSLENTHLYRNSKDKEIAIEKVIALNNDHNDYQLAKDLNYLLIKEEEGYYDIRIGKDYPATYKIHSKSGKIYDFSDPYKKFYPNPVANPPFPPPVGGPWKELKE